jgi:hypothetical protein
VASSNHIPLLVEEEEPFQNIVTDLINSLLGNRSLNTVQHATIEEGVFSVDPTDAPIDWLESGHVICVYCRSLSVPRLCKYVTEFVKGSYRSVVSWRSESRRIFSSEFPK